MLEVEEQISLKSYNTFGIDVNASFLVKPKNLEDLQSILNDDRFKDLPLLILGGGSNVLFTQDFPGLVIINEIKGLEILDETSDEVLLKIMSGEVWNDVVNYAVQKNLGGIENLSLIPGTAGAAPMQNIGAYGIELENVFENLEAVRLSDGAIISFDKYTCAFGYRDSYFKKAGKGKYFIYSITLRLSKHPKINISYGDIQKTLQEWHIKSPGVSEVSKAVCSIRNAKLPNPKEIGNAGSFFKNPEIRAEQFAQLKGQFPEMPGYPLANDMVKVPAGWLIEYCGWKGKIVGNTGSHKKQALVLVNYGNATGKEILALAQAIQTSVFETFGIEIYPEVNVI